MRYSNPTRWRSMIKTISFSICLLYCSCSHTPALKDDSTHSLSPVNLSQQLKEKAKDSKVDIEYILGRDHYRFSALSQGEGVTAASLVNRHILEQGPIDPESYPGFLEKASEFIRHTGKNSTDNAIPCHSPFIVTVRIKNDTQVARGCRTSLEGGALSKLVRDGEFLLYSKN